MTAVNPESVPTPCLCTPPLPPLRQTQELPFTSENTKQLLSASGMKSA